MDRQVHAGQLHEIGAQSVLVAVSLILQSHHLLHDLIVKFTGQTDGELHGLGRDAGHLACDLMGALDSDSRGGQQALVQQGILVLCLIVGNGKLGQLDQQTAQRQQHGGSADIEAGMDHCNALRIHNVFQKLPREEQSNTVEQHHKDQSTNNIEVQMHHCGTAGILVGTDRSHHGRHASTDVLTQNDGDGAAEGDDTGGTKALENTNGSGGRLDHSGQHRTNQNTDKRIGEGHHQVCKPRLVTQELHGAAHEIHTGHQCHKAKKNRSDEVLLLALGEHVEDNADDTHERGKRRRLKQLNEKAVTLQTA